MAGGDVAPSMMATPEQCPAFEGLPDDDVITDLRRLRADPAAPV